MLAVIEKISSSELFSGMENNMAAFLSIYGRAEGCTLHAAADTLHLLCFWLLYKPFGGARGITPQQ